MNAAADFASGRSFVGASAISIQDVHLLSAAAGFYFSSRAIFVLVAERWLHAGTNLGVSAMFAVSALLLLAAFLQSLGADAHPIAWMGRTSTFRWIMLYLAFSACSLLWSATVSPLASCLYWCALAADVATLALLFRGTGPSHAAHSILIGFIWGSCLLSAIAWIMPTAADLRLGDLEYFNTNQIGNLCALGAYSCSILTKRGQGRWGIMTAFLTLTLFRSLSKATLAAFIASQGYMLLRDSGMTRKKKLLLVLAAMVLLAAFWGLADAYYDVYTTTGNQAETLTGRTAIWAWTLDAAVEKPWFGNGIDAMWKVAPPFGSDFFESRHAENELLQQFFAYGIAGIVMLAGIYGSLWRRLRAVPDRPERIILSALLIYVWIRGVAEAEAFDLLLPLWMMVTLLALSRGASIPDRSELTEVAPPAGSQTALGVAG